MISRVRGMLLAAALLAVGGCHNTVVVETTPAPDRLFVTWELHSATFGPVACPLGSTVVMDAFELRTGDRITTAFVCSDYQGTSVIVGEGDFDVVLDLTDEFGTVLSESRLRASTIGVFGTVDLGHVIFTLP